MSFPHLHHRMATDSAILGTLLARLRGALAANTAARQDLAAAVGRITPGPAASPAAWTEAIASGQHGWQDHDSQPAPGQPVTPPPAVADADDFAATLADAADMARLTFEQARDDLAEAKRAFEAAALECETASALAVQADACAVSERRAANVLRTATGYIAGDAR